MLHEDYAKICSVCEAVISDFFKVKKRMIELQRGFINFLDEHQHQQNPSDHIIPEVFTSPHPPDVKKTSTTVITERKLSKNIQRTRLEKPANQNHELPELDKQANYCAICEKSFSHRFTAISHMKMVHLKIKVRKSQVSGWRAFNENFSHCRIISVISALMQVAPSPI